MLSAFPTLKCVFKAELCGLASTMLLVTGTFVQREVITGHCVTHVGFTLKFKFWDDFCGVQLI